MRLTNILVAAIPIVAALLYKQSRRAGLCVTLVIAGFALSTGIGFLLTGVTNPYKATRASFNHETGYPVGEDAAAALTRFETDLATSSLSWAPKADLRMSAYSTIYFFLGRHSGILVYFPASLVLILALVGRPDRVGLALMTGSGLLIVLYLLWLPANYFGGSTFIGNRYYLVPYVTLLLAPLRLPSRKSLLLPWCIAAAVFGSAVYSIATTRHLDNGSQSHTRAGLFRLLPYESTARRIDGQQDRRWLGDGIRCVDPFADVLPWGFALDSSNPPSEFLLATSWAGKAYRFLVLADSELATLQISDWGSASNFTLSPTAEGSKAVVSFETSRAWRRHPFVTESSGSRSVQSIRALRFGIHSYSNKPVRAWIQYLGDPGRLDRSDYSYEVLEFSIPQSVLAATTSRLPVRLLNKSNFTWRDSPIMPVTMSYKLLSETLDRPLEGVRTRLFRSVRPGQVLDTHIEVHWPEIPGTYQLVVDLVQENAVWFEERVGRPLAQGWVEVQPTVPTHPEE